MTTEPREVGIGPPGSAEASPERARELFGSQPPPGARIFEGPGRCPACGSHEVVWACTQTGLKPADVDPRIDNGQGLAETYLCTGCSAGWVEDDSGGPVAWV